MRILINLTFLWPKDKLTMFYGFSVDIIKFVQGIPEEHMDNYILLFNKQSEEDMHAMFPKFKYECVDLPENTANASSKTITKIKGLLRNRRVLKEFINTYDADVFFNHLNTDYTTWFNSKIPFVGMIHDLTLLKIAPKGVKGWIQKNVLKAYYRFKIKNSTRIICISDFTKTDVINYFKLNEKEAEKLITIYNVVEDIEASKAPKGYDFSQKYILCVNGIRQSKNIVTLVKAFALIKDKTDANLLLVGSLNEKSYWDNNVLPLIKEKELKDRTYRLEYLEREELRYVYENAELFVTTSLNEGFGNTPIEAAFYHCPVISSKCDSLPEVTMGLVDYYEPPMDENALSMELLKVLSNPPSKEELLDISDKFRKAYGSQKRISKFENVFMSIANAKH